MNNNINNNSENKEQDNSTLYNNNLSSSNDKKAFPKLRFKEFTESWEQFKIEELIKERNERSNKDEELLSVTIAKGVIKQSSLLKHDTSSYNKSNYKVVKINDIPYNTMRLWQGAIGISYYNGIISPAYTVLTPTTNANSIFFMELFKKKSTLAIFKKWSQGLTSDTWNLKYNTLSKINFFVPKIEEQNKIADFLLKVNNLLTLHQKLLDNLKKYKKGLLTAIFERKIRFKDKNGNDYPNWKEYKFEDFLVESKHLPDKQDLNKRITVKLNLKGVEKRKVTPEEKEGASINYIRKEGQFIYGKQNIHKGAFGIIPKELNNFQSSSDIPSFDFINNIIIDNYFYYYLSQEKVYEKLEYKMTGTGSKRLHSNVFLQELIFIPCIEEQKKIIDFLTILDKKIEKQDELLKKMYLYKNGLLQQLFI